MEEEYKGHRIELRARETDGSALLRAERHTEPELLIDNQRVGYGRLPNGQYYLDAYAYDWRDDLLDLARRFIDSREETEAILRKRSSGGEE